MPYCRNCGKELGENDRECPLCHYSEPANNENKVIVCRKCGKEIGVQVASYCPYCGAAVRPNRDYPLDVEGKQIRGEKSFVIAVILSLIIPGLGTAYVGPAMRGLLIFMVNLILTLGFAFGGILHPVVSMVSIILNVVMYLYSLYDAAKQCNDSNKLWYEYQDSL